MARSLILIVTASLDGFIADPHGGVDWLANPTEGLPPDYLSLVESIDTLVMGSATYLVSLELAGGTALFDDHEVFVFTSRSDLPPYPGVTVVAEPATGFTARLKERDGGPIWLFGGGRLAVSLSDAGLIDEYLIAVQPIVLGDGIPLWPTPHERANLELVCARPWPDGIAELRYRHVLQP